MDYVDEEEEPDPQLNALTNAIIGAAIEVHKAIGPGHPESAYQRGLEIEFGLRGIRFFRQYPIQLTYKGHVVGEGRLDFLVENTVVVEIKSVEVLSKVHTAQALGYLRVTRFKLAIVINFNVAVLKDVIRRVAL